jgi:hypothetical protein
MAINFLKMLIDTNRTDQATITEDFFTAVLFDGRINTDMTQCWKLHPFTTICTGGYGAKTISGLQVQLHRLSWWLHNGLPEMTPDMVVRHKCDNPECTNPEHLEIGTQSQNIKEAYDRGLRVVPPKKEKVRHTACTECRAHTHNKCVYEGDDDCERCKSLGLTCVKVAQAHPTAFVPGTGLGETNKHCKVKDADIIAMRAERAGGAKVMDIAMKYGITPSYASSLIKGKAARSVTE